MASLPRLRQAVLAASDLDTVVESLRRSFSLGQPFADPGVATFGLRNAVFAIGDTFLEVVSPLEEDTSAGRLLDRRGGDCGYMVMFQVDDLAAARQRAAENGVRIVFEVDLDDMSEIHLHPADIGGAIVSLSTPTPPETWRWGGPDWTDRSVAGAVSRLTIGVEDPDTVAQRWEAIVGGLPGVTFVADGHERGPVEIALGLPATRDALQLGGVRITSS
jgi:hypothetical protein